MSSEPRLDRPAVLVGTASWTDKTLIACGRFYPKGATSAEARLRYYASRFPLVEVDSSYYAVPAAATAQLWAERTPPGFTMNIKAFRLFTGHQTPPHVLPNDLLQQLAALRPALARKRMLYDRELPDEVRDALWQRFQEALQPLRAAGRLGLVHFQFPPWLLCNREGHDFVRAAVERVRAPTHGADVAPPTVSVEFRHRSWFDGARRIASTLAFERELDVVHTVVDGPQGFVNSVPAVWETTHADFALVRLHGRNAATWNIAREGTVASDRFDYDYAEGELMDLASTIVDRLAARAAARVHVVFNNNMEDQGQRNASTLTDLLRRNDRANTTVT
jgi:uncharacterized protein YecE (DUF72 family)